MAGTSLANLVFVTVMASITNMMEKQLLELELVSFLDAGPGAGLFGHVPLDDAAAVPILATAWIDDFAVPVISQASSLVSKVRSVFTFVWRVFHMFGLELNMKPGMSAFLPMPAGPGSE